MTPKPYQIQVSDWGHCPAGRYREDSQWSGEAFRDDVLHPALLKHKLVHINLNNILGFGSSWLEEVFGGLVRLHGYKELMLRDRLSFTHEIESDVLRIWKFIEDADSKINEEG